MASALQLKKEDEPAETKCPSCGAVLPEGAVLCVQCGYDFRSGRRVDEEAAPRTNPLMIAGIALLVAVAAGLVAWRILGSSSTPAPVVAAPTPVVAPPPPAPVPAAPTNVTLPEVVATNAPATNQVEAVAETNAPPAEPALDPAVVEAEQRNAVEAQLDQMAPMYNAGDELELRLTNGLVQRGVFTSRSESGLVVQINSNQARTVEFLLLDRGSRVRSDPQYRARYIDFHVQQRVQKILQQEQTPAEAK